jgi:hypothetical protein
MTVTDLVEFPHGGQVALEFLQTPEGGDAQFGVLHLDLQLSLSPSALLPRPLVSKNSEDKNSSKKEEKETLDSMRPHPAQIKIQLNKTREIIS